MATFTNNRNVLSIEGKVKVIWHIENGREKADLCREFGLVNSIIQMICKNRTMIISAFEWNGSRIKLFWKLEQSDINEMLLSGLSKRKVAM